MQKYFCHFAILLALAPLVLFWQIVPRNAYADAHFEELGELVAISNKYAFFYGSILFDDFNQGQILHPVTFRVLEFGKNIQETRIQTPIGVPKTCFVSDSQIVLWNAGFAPGLDRVQLTGQIFDCNILQTIQRFDSVVLEYNHT